jgi:hydroxypyruvate isomerase
MVSLNAPYGNDSRDESGFGVIAGAEARFSESVGEAIDYVVTIDCPVIHCLSGHAPEGETDAAIRTRLAANLRHAA